MLRSALHPAQSRLLPKNLTPPRLKPPPVTAERSSRVLFQVKLAEGYIVYKILSARLEPYKAGMG
jgi:hypothetical protein